MNYWKYHDEKLIELKQLYNRISKQTQNKLSSIFSEIDNLTQESLYSIADKKQKEKVNIKIEEWKDLGLLVGMFGMIANNIYNRTRVKNSEILELLIYGTYIEENSKLENKELGIFKDIVNNYYIEGQKEVYNTLPKKQRKELSIMSETLFLTILEKTTPTGYNWNQYKEAIAKYNAEQIYKQVIIDIQQQKEPEIDSDVYKNIIQKQNNAKLNINPTTNKISGAVDIELISLNNEAKLEGITKIDNDAKVKFIAVEDEVTTKMCKSLDSQIFNVNDENIFTRYSANNQNYVKYKCKGLVQGLNLPPINDHFHFCRSTITYQVSVANKDDFKYPTYIRINSDKKYNAKKEIEEINSAILEMPFKIQKLIRNSQIEIFTKGILKNKEGKVITNSFYDRNKNIIYIYQGADKYEVIHEIGHLVETQLEILSDKKYINIRNSELENYPIYALQDLSGYNNTKGIKSSKFVTEFQGKMYKNDFDGNERINKNGKLNLNCLGDYFSEGFTYYFTNQQKLIDKDIKLYNYIKEVIK